MALRFLDCEIDVAERTLRRGGALVDVDPKAFDLLVLLAQNTGQLVPRETIVATLWPDVVVGDAAVSQCIRRARIAIGDRDRSARRIETVYGHGLRLTATVSQAGMGLAVRADARRGHLPLVGPTSAATPATGFVGRTTELARLVAAFDATATGGTRILLVAGEPGIGKTRLVDEFLTHCARRGASVAWGRCHEDADAPAYWPWAQAMRPLLEPLDAAALTPALGREAALLARVIPALRDRAGEPESAGAPADSYALFDPWTRLLATLARRAPVVIALDDLQWADEGTLRLLRFLARERPAAPLVVVGTFRDVDPQRVGERNTSVPVRTGVREVVALGALSPDELATLAGVDPDTPSIARLHELTGGNAFFAVEMLATHRDLATLDRRTPPQGIRSWVADRIARVSPSVRALLEAASVLGEEFSPSTLRSVAALPDAARDRYDAVASGLLRPSGATTMRFAHALVREVLYEAIPDVEKARLHESAAHAIEAEHGADLEPQVELLARHCGAALDLALRAGGQPEVERVRRAVDYALRAARRAAAVASWEECARHATQALEWLGDRGDAVMRLEVRVALGEAQMASGALDAGRATLRAAAPLARAQRSWPALARIAFARIGRFGRSLSAEEPEGLALLDEVVAAADAASDAALAARVVTRRALVYKPALEETAKRALLDRAERLARRSGDDGVLSYALWARHLASWDPRERPQRAALSRELLALGTRSPDVEVEALARICGIRDAADAGDLPAIAATTDAYAAMLDRVLHPVVRFYLTPRLVMRALLEGRTGDAERLIVAGLQAPDAHGVRAQLFDPLPLQLVFLRREQGRIGEMADAVDRVAAANDRLPFVIGLQGMARAALGQLDHARAHLDDLFACDFEDVAFDHNRLMVFTEAAEVCAALGDAGLAAGLYERLTPFDHHHIVVADGLGYLDAVARPLGLLAAARGDLPAAIAHLEEAVETYRAMGARARLAHAEADLARVLARSGGADARAEALRASASCAARSLELDGLAAVLAGT